MTRNEAIKKIRDSVSPQLPVGLIFASQLVDALHGLDMLKFEEPKSVYKRARDVLYGIQALNVAPAEVIAALEYAGLKIVEKD